MNEHYTGYQYTSEPASADLTESPEAAESSHDSMSSGEIRDEIEYTRNQMSDTLDAILRKLSPSELVNQAMRYFNGPKAFASNLGNTVKKNPMPVALLGIGLAWLIASSSAGDGSRATVHEEASESTYPEREGRSRVKEKMEGAVSTVRDKMSDMSQSIKDRTEKVKEKVWSAREKASQTREKISGTAAGASQQASRLSIATRHQAQRVKSGVTYLWNEQPFVLAAMGFAIGAVLGMSLPSTHLEDEAMGQKRDQLKEQAKETWEKSKETVKGAAESAQETMASALGSAMPASEKTSGEQS